MFKLKNIICLIFLNISLVSLAAVFNTMEVYDQAEKIDYIGFYQKGTSNFSIVGKYEEKDLEIPTLDKYYLSLGDVEYRIGLLTGDYVNKNFIFNEIRTKEFINISIGKKNKLSKEASGFVYDPTERKGYFFIGDFNTVFPNFYGGYIGIIYDEQENFRNKSYKVLLIRGNFYIEKFVQGIDRLYKNIIFDFSKTYPSSAAEVMHYKCIFNESGMDVTSVYQDNIELNMTSISLEMIIKKMNI